MRVHGGNNLQRENLEPDIYTFTNFREFLERFLEFKKKKNSAFSMRSFSRLCGFKSPNYICLLLSGRRRLTERTLKGLSKACGLKGNEARYFEALVRWNQSKDFRKDEYFTRLHNLLLKRNEKIITSNQELILSRWYYQVIREMTSLPDFKNDSAWIAARLRNQVSPTEVERAIKILTKLKLLKEVSGELVQCESLLTTTNDKFSKAIQQFHRDMIPRALNSLSDHCPVDERDIRSMTMPISKKTAQRIKLEVKKLQDKIIDLALSEQGPEEIYQFNLQLFPLTTKSTSTIKGSSS